MTWFSIINSYQQQICMLFILCEQDNKEKKKHKHTKQIAQHKSSNTANMSNYANRPVNCNNRCRMMVCHNKTKWAKQKQKKIKHHHILPCKLLIAKLMCVCVFVLFPVALRISIYWKRVAIEHCHLSCHILTK